MTTTQQQRDREFQEESLFPGRKPQLRTVCEVFVRVRHDRQVPQAVPRTLIIRGREEACFVDGVSGKALVDRLRTRCGVEIQYGEKSVRFRPSKDAFEVEHSSVGKRVGSDQGVDDPIYAVLGKQFPSARLTASERGCLLTAQRDSDRV